LLATLRARYTTKRRMDDSDTRCDVGANGNKWRCCVAAAESCASFAHSDATSAALTARGCERQEGAARAKFLSRWTLASGSCRLRHLPRHRLHCHHAPPQLPSHLPSRALAPPPPRTRQLALCIPPCAAAASPHTRFAPAPAVGLPNNAIKMRRRYAAEGAGAGATRAGGGAVSRQQQHWGSLLRLLTA